MSKEIVYKEATVNQKVSVKRNIKIELHRYKCDQCKKHICTISKGDNYSHKYAKLNACSFCKKHYCNKHFKTRNNACLSCYKKYMKPYQDSINQYLYGKFKDVSKNEKQKMIEKYNLDYLQYLISLRKNEEKGNNIFNSILVCGLAKDRTRKKYMIEIWDSYR